MSVWTDFFDSPEGSSGGLLGIGELDLLHVRDEKVINTQGGSSSASTWNQRDLNTVLVNEIDGSSLSSDQITLPAGTYDIEASAPCNTSDRHRLRFRNITDGSTAVAGMSLHSSATDNQTPHSLLTGRFIITEEKVFQLQQWTQTAQASNGLGVATNSVEVEVYADVRIRRVTAVQGAGGLPFKGAHVYRSSTKAIGTASTQALDFDTVVFDEGGWWSNGDHFLLTVPAGVTKVIVWGQVQWDNANTGSRIVFIFKNGIRQAETQDSGSSVNFEMQQVTSGIMEVDEGDTLAVYVNQNSGGNLNLNFADAASMWIRVMAVESVAPSTTPRGALVKRTGTFALVNDSEVALPFDDEEYDPEDIHNNSVNNTRLTVPTGVTHVRLYGHMQVGSDTTGYRSLRITKLGSSFVGTGFSDTSAASRDTQELTVNSAIVEVVGGNYFELVGFQNAGETRNVTPYFAMEIVAPAVVAGGDPAQVVQTLADGANIAWDHNTSRTATVTLGGDRTLDNPTNSVEGLEYTLKVIQDGTGTRLLTYGSAYKFAGGTAPTLSTGINDIDVLRFWFDGTDYIKIGFEANIS